GAIRLALEHEFVDPTYGSSIFSLAGHAALWRRDLDQARRVQESWRVFAVRGKWVDACRQSLDAGIAALEGRTVESLGLFNEAAQTLRDDGVMLDTCLCLLDEVAVLGPAHPGGQAAADEARQIVKRLRAVALEAHLDRLLAVDPIGAAMGSLAGPGPSSDEIRRQAREEEAEAEERKSPRLFSTPPR
ncbi:MAG: hypothetical protein M3253_04550, partial [Chloroflexota bacterium]|nr:hypothetical protein [Chloroflexota bacterium]